MPIPAVTATSPAKVILFGEHAVNRGQLALATSIGLDTHCRIEENDGDLTVLAGAGQTANYHAEQMVVQATRIDDLLQARDYRGVGQCVVQDFFASSVYILGQVSREYGLPPLRVSFESKVPMSCGLGSGGAVHAALALALTHLLESRGQLVTDIGDYVSALAYSGDRVAHGGVASGLDTQTSLAGGVVEYRDNGPAVQLSVPPGLQLVVGHTGVPKGSTGSVNSRIRAWLEEDPARLAIFQTMGRVAVDAKASLQAGKWAEVGRLMNANHELLVTTGASHPLLDKLCAAARSAGALGAKLTGAGGGGVMIALVFPETASAVADALRTAGGTSLEAQVAVAGATVRSN